MSESGGLQLGNRHRVQFIGFYVATKRGGGMKRKIYRFFLSLY